MHVLGRSTSWVRRKITPTRLHGSARRLPRGQRAGHVGEGPPGTWEALRFPLEIPGRAPGEQAPACVRCAPRAQEQRASAREVGPGEGNEARAR
jgi:hypothetical protein